MSRRSVRPRFLGVLAVLVTLAAEAQAQAPAQAVRFAPACACGYPGPHVHYAPGGPAMVPQGQARASYRPNGMPNATADPGPIYGLPRGRRYYGGRFFGSFNNRFYGPQYGNF